MKLLSYSSVFVLLLLLNAAGTLLLSCKHEVEPPASTAGSGTSNAGGNTTTGSGNGSGTTTTTTCDTTKIYFQQQVLPVLLSNCTMGGCHDAVSHQEGIILTSYENVMRTAGIRPGRPAESELYEVLLETNPDKRMPRPPKSPLSASQIKIIRDWIQQGALNLVCNSSCDSSRFSYTAIIQPLLSSKCQGCHSGAAASGGIDLSSYAAVKINVNNGKLWGAVNHNPGYSPMPKNGNKLSGCELTLLRKWIEAGALNN